jgi:DNA ligase-1
MADILASYLPNGADGEIMTGSTFQETTSAVMTEIGSANFKQQFTFYWFDWVQDGNLEQPYIDRVKAIQQYVSDNAPPSQVNIMVAIPKTVANAEECLLYEKEALSRGYEGLILRKATSPYKCGRSTVKQAFMLKLKRFVDDEAEIIGYDELMHNLNEAFLDERGYTKRSSHQENLHKSGKLGSFLVQNKKGDQFKVGTGFDDAQRVEYWNNRISLMGNLVKYKYFPVGIKELPRHPVFCGFRDPDDLS